VQGLLLVQGELPFVSAPADWEAPSDRNTTVMLM
jgi:hypothetical protein